MKNEMIQQTRHFWRVYAAVVKAFDDISWTNLGQGKTTPDRLAYHIMQSSRFYREDTSSLAFASGSPFERDTEERKALPGREDILSLSEEFSEQAVRWIGEMDLEGENPAFPWTGQTRFSVYLFLTRHNTYHLGEMEALLNENLRGEAEDFWIKSI